MVSIKLSLAAATAAFLQVASARKCTASVQDFLDNGMGLGGGHHYRVAVWFNGAEDSLDIQDNYKGDSKLYPYEGVQTLKSDELGGDVLIWADKSSASAQSQLDGCQVQFMESDYIEGEVEGSKNYKICKAEFDC